MTPKTVLPMYDVVIIGAGAAGLSAALSLIQSDEFKNAQTEPNILVISKLQSLRSHTGSAEGGIAASLGNIEPDNWQWHYYDTIKGSDWLADQDAVKILAQQAPETIINLERYGVAFSRTDDGHIAQRKFGGHTAQYGKYATPRAAYAEDRIGHQILHSLWGQVASRGVQFAEEWYVTDLVVNHKNHSVEGVVAFDTHKGEIHAIQAKNVILATGGAGRLFHTTSNSWDLTGDGLALSLQADLQLEDIEFMQFHPTGLSDTGILLSEAVRAEGGVLRNSIGEAFMSKYAPEQKDLAARDVVSRAIMQEIQEGRGVCDPLAQDPNAAQFVYLDMRDIPQNRIREALPQVLETVEAYRHLNPSTDLIPIKPTAHYTMGGIPTTTNTEVYFWENQQRIIIDGLYAAGECACISVHGANRLGGNSLLDACLFGTKAGKQVAQQLHTQSPSTDNTLVISAAESRKQSLRAILEDANDLQTESTPDTNAQENKNSSNTSNSAIINNHSNENAYSYIAAIGNIMEQFAAVHCDKKSLTTGLNKLHELHESIKSLHAHSSMPAFNQEITAIWEAQHLYLLATAMLEASLARHESRGSFMRDDYPQRDDTNFLTHSMTSKSDTEHATAISWQPVHIIDLPPQQRLY